MTKLIISLLATLPVVAAVGPQVAPHIPVLRAGVSVEMPVTTSAIAVPAADAEDALVVAVTAKGNVYVEVTPVSPADLAGKVREGLSGSAGKRLYIKGDARTSQADMAKVLDAALKAGVEAPILLTAQGERPEPGHPAMPKGMEVRVGQSLPPASDSIVVKALDAGAGLTLSINNLRIPSDRLESALRQLLQKSGPKLVVLVADQRLAFRDVVRVIDTCRSAGAKVFLATAGT